MRLNTELYRKNKKSKNIVKLLILVVLMVGTTFGLYVLYYSYKDERFVGADLIFDLLSNLLVALIAYFGYDILFNTYTERENNRIMQENIVSAIYHDSRGLSLFTNAQKEEFIKRNICALIGSDKGKELFDRHIKKYLSKALLYREDVEYVMKLEELTENLDIQGDTYSCDEYFLFRQDYTAKRCFADKSKDISFKVVFVFDEAALDQYANDDTIFMRDVLSIADFSKIENLDNDQIKDILVKDFGLSVKFNDKDEDFELKYSVKQDSVVVEFADEKDFRRKVLRVNKEDDVRYFKCHLKFNIPLKKSMNRIHGLIAEPTKNYNLLLNYPKSVKNISQMSYCNDSEDQIKIEHYEDLNLCKVNVAGIVYPRSGVVFFWDY